MKSDKKETFPQKLPKYKGIPLKGKELEEHLKAFTDIEESINALYGKSHNVKNLKK